MLRVEIAELLMDIEGKKFDEDSLKVDLISLLEDEGVEVEKWPDSVNLEKIVNLSGVNAINMSAARILYHLDTEGMDIVGSGILDDDEDWERLSDLLDQE
jgi:hypothetical protein